MSEELKQDQEHADWKAPKTGEKKELGQEIIDRYELEKIKSTQDDLKHANAVIENYLFMVKKAKDLGIDIKRNDRFDKIRYPNNPAGPDNDINKISILFEKGQRDISRQLTGEQNDKIAQELVNKKEVLELPSEQKEQLFDMYENIGFDIRKAKGDKVQLQETASNLFTFLNNNLNSNEIGFDQQTNLKLIHLAEQAKSEVDLPGYQQGKLVEITKILRKHITR